MKIAIDLGGTFIRALLFDGDQPVGRVKKVDCPAKGPAEGVVNAICNLIASLLHPQVTMIGIAVPSVVDSEKGIVYNVNNIPSWKEVHLKEEVEKRFAVETRVGNDVNCFVLGEKYYGEGRPFKNFVGMTLGTGLGAGIVIDGKLYHGANAVAGEIGSIPYLDSDFEHFTSSLFLAKKTPLTGIQLTQKAEAGDPEALSIFQEMGSHVGKLLQVLIYTFDPQAVIIGGGLAHAEPYFKPAMTDALHRGFLFPAIADRLKILFTTLADANLKGAIHL